MRQLGVLWNSDIEYSRTDSVSSKLYVLVYGGLDFRRSRIYWSPKGADRVSLRPDYYEPEGQIGFLRNQIYLTWWGGSLGKRDWFWGVGMLWEVWFVLGVGWFRGVRVCWMRE